MATGATARIQPVIRWPERRLGRLRIEYEAAVAAPARRGIRGIIGARGEEGTIRLQVERVRAGENDALGELFGEFRPDILRLCTRMLGPVDAEDATSETFQRAQRRFDRYDTTQPLGRWLRSIASHDCIDRLRRRSLEKRLFEPFESEVDEVDEVSDVSEKPVSALDEIVQTRRQSAVRVALDGLPDRYRAPLVLRYFADLDYDAIGDELGLTRSQVASSLFRAKQLLRGLLHSEQESGP
jgi:RNA polymerase sigma-70 factor (ECF subfamily)